MYFENQRIGGSIKEILIITSNCTLFTVYFLILRCYVYTLKIRGAIIFIDFIGLSYDIDGYDNTEQFLT